MSIDYYIEHDQAIIGLEDLNLQEEGGEKEEEQIDSQCYNQQ